MADSTTASNSNGSQQTVDALTNDDDTGSMATGQTNPNRVSIPIRRTTLTHIDPAARDHENHQMTNQAIGRALSMHNPRRFRLGHTLPNCMIFGSNQGGQGINRITHPMDEMNIDEILSNSVSVCLYLRESIAIQDTQPHNMPTPVIFNRIHRELATSNENNSPRVDTRVPTSMIQDGGSLEPIGQVTIREITMTMPPTERPHDTEFSVDTFESPSGHQLNTGNEEDAHHCVYENTLTINNENHLPPTNEDQTIINPGAATGSNQAIVVTGPPNATTMPEPSSPEAKDNEPSVQNPGIRESPITPLLNLLVPKVPSPFDSRDESSGDSVASTEGQHTNLS